MQYRLVKLRSTITDGLGVIPEGCIGLQGERRTIFDRGFIQDHGKAPYGTVLSLTTAGSTWKTWASGKVSRVGSPISGGTHNFVDFKGNLAPDH